MLAAPALAAESTHSVSTTAAPRVTRVDLYDTQSRRTGHAIVDERTGRVDFYDEKSRRTRYGKIESTGRLERFDLEGRREGTTGVPSSKRGGAR